MELMSTGKRDTPVPVVEETACAGVLPVQTAIPPSGEMPLTVLSKGVVLLVVLGLHGLLLTAMLRSASVAGEPVLKPTIVAQLVAPTPPKQESVKPKSRPKPQPKPKPEPVPIAPPVEAPPVETALAMPEPEPEPIPEPVLEPEPEPVVTPPRSNARYLNNRQPGYPSVSQRLKEEGKVILEVLVLADGTVGDLRVKHSSGYERLDLAAHKAVARWRFEPARRGGEPIDFRYEVPVTFKLARR